MPASPEHDPTDIDRLVRDALAEDVGNGDVTTSATVPEDTQAEGLITQKEAGVIFGLDICEAVFAHLDPHARFARRAREGQWRDGGPVLHITGTARALLTAERTALNFLGRLSGVATAAARAAQRVEGTNAKVLDTRKTTPGLRALEKQAVKAGGATNHRAGLYDAILIKENHIALAGGITAAIEQARTQYPHLAATLEIEVRSTEEIDEALAAGAPRLLLDNMDDAQLRAAVEQIGGRATLEASGGVTLETLRSRAETGVDFVSLGAITHSAPALDLSLILQALT